MIRRVIDQLVTADDSRILSGRNAGFTAAMTFPTSGIFGGQGAFIGREQSVPTGL